MTARQLDAWECWLDQDRNEPGVAEHYLMKVASEIRRIYCWLTSSQHPETLDEFKIKWVREQQRSKSDAPPPAAWDEDKVHEAIWRARLGVKGPRSPKAKIIK